MTARFIVGDTREITASLPDGSVDLVLTSPPFLALRSYLPADHPDKGKEIGSEANPAAFIDVLLELTAEWRRILAPHGSIVIELGDTYSGSGGAGGDYNADGLRDGQQKFSGSAVKRAANGIGDDYRISRAGRGAEWPLPKCLALVPELYRIALAYGINPLTGQPSPAGRWRVRNVVRWVRPNPPVGALGDKFRPATSDLVVACVAGDRWFDLDAVRVPGNSFDRPVGGANGQRKQSDDTMTGFTNHLESNPAGAPPLDWWQIAARPGAVEQAAVLRRHLAAAWHNAPERTAIERAIELLETDPGVPNDWWQIVPGGYSGAHYAVWPPALCERPIEAMCPRRVCVTCGKPSRRITGEVEYTSTTGGRVVDHFRGVERAGHALTWAVEGGNPGHVVRTAPTVGWSSCGCPNTDGLQLDGYHTGTGWRPGVVFDPFAGSGTTLVVAHGHSRDSIGADLDPRNAQLAAERLGMFLTVETTERVA